MVTLVPQAPFSYYLLVHLPTFIRGGPHGSTLICDRQEIFQVLIVRAFACNKVYTGDKAILNENQSIIYTYNWIGRTPVFFGLGVASVKCLHPRSK